MCEAFPSSQCLDEKKREIAKGRQGAAGPGQWRLCPRPSAPDTAPGGGPRIHKGSGCARALPALGLDGGAAREPGPAPLGVHG